MSPQVPQTCVDARLCAVHVCSSRPAGRHFTMSLMYRVKCVQLSELPRRMPYQKHVAVCYSAK